MEKDDIICSCFSLSVGDIEDAMSGGCTSYEEVQDETSCGTACGCCEDDIRELVASLKK